MKKRFFSFVLAICLIIPCMFAIVGCSGTPATLTKEDYIKVFDSFATTLSTSIEDQVTTIATNIPEEDFIDISNNTQAKTMPKVCRTLITFIRNIYAREDYVVKTTHEDCVVIDTTNPGHAYTMNIRMNTAYNSETSVVTTDIYVEYENNSATYVQYFVFDIEYDFTIEKLNSFSILGFNGIKNNETIDGVEYFKFKDNILKTLSHEAESFAPFATQVFNEMNMLKTPAWATSPIDYSAEYWAAMEAEMI